MEKHGSIAAKLKAALCAMCYAFIKGVTMLMLSHGSFFSPSGAAVCAQHMEFLDAEISSKPHQKRPLCKKVVSL